MGKFINTTYTNTVDSVINTMNSLLDNPYYKWIDQKPTKVTYFHLNKDKSTLDPSSKLTWEEIGSNSSLVYDRIDDVLVYGLSQITLALDRGDFGIESNAIEGELTILPNTIEPPYPVDYFYIDYIKEKISFRVNSVSYDTLDNGANLYNISYKAESADPSVYDTICNQVANTYKMLIDNNGSGFKSIIRSEVYDFVKLLDDFLISLKLYYKSLFYSTRVQTFIFKYIEDRFYDPYMIEFIISNDLLSGDNEYIHVCHQASVDNLFPITYTYTMFHCLETKDREHLDRYRYQAQAEYIKELNTTFHDRIEDYYKIDYKMKVPQLGGVIPCFPQDLIDHIRYNDLFTGKYSIYNIIIKYLNNRVIDSDDLNCFSDTVYEDNETLFYAIPCTIYCLESYAKEMLIDKTKQSK